MNKVLLTTTLLLFASLGLLATESHIKFNKISYYTFNLPSQVNGTVKDSSGSPLPGVSIRVKGTSNGTLSNGEGRFTLNVNPGDVLEFSYIGFLSKEVSIVNSSELTIILKSNAKTLNGVVVTALGIKRSEKSLTYSTQQVSGVELTNVKSDNLMNSLNGKIAGVNISPGASGVGGSSKVILRGNRSALGNNQPLYVLDGVPISNAGNNNGQPNGTYGGTPDGGDGISNLNPDDIESMTVLKGASAAALYGSQAANGVIVITTKKGRAGKTSINFSSSASLDKNAYTPKFQSNYGQTAKGATDSWGAKISGSPDNLKQFYQTGTNFTNAINLSGGSDIAQTFFSYANTTAKGVEPGNKLTRNNLDLHETGHFLNNKLTVDANINYITQEINNSPTIGFYTNPLTGLYLFPRGQDISPFKNNYLGPIGLNGVPTQNWPYHEDVQQNPWWIINKNTNDSKRNRIIANASVKYDFTNWLSLQARGTVDRTNDVYNQYYWAGTLAPLASDNNNGSYSGSDQTQLQKYGDAILNFNLPGKSAFKLDGLIGTSIQDNSQTGINWGSNTNATSLNVDNRNYGLFLPNLFTLQNIEAAPAGSPNPEGNTINTLPLNHNQLQAIFANANLSYKEWVYLTLTARNDWSSNLAFTPKDHYFYPSAGLSFILSQMVKLPSIISYAKIRGTYAQVGNTVIQYSPNPVNYPSANSVVLSNVAPYPTLKPESTKSFEFGADLRMFSDRLSLNFSYYKSNTYSQSIKVIPPAPSGYGSGYVNGGNIQNKGFEFLISYNAYNSNDFNWNTSLNGSRNVNKIIDLDSKDGINKFQLTAQNSYQSYLAKGGQFGDIWGQTLQKDPQGRVIITAQGLPLLSSAFSRIANPAPKFQLGWNNSLSYKGFSLSFLVDAKLGGEVVSVMESLLDSYGVSQRSGQARDAGGVQVNGVDQVSGKAVTTVDAQKWYTSIGGRNAALGQYVYDASVVRLREAALGYTLPFAKESVVKSIKLSLTGRNLIYFYNKAPYDPEVTSSTGNGLGGVDVFNQPALRSFGLKLSATL